MVVVLFVFKSETRSSLSAPSHGLMVSAEILLQQARYVRRSERPFSSHYINYRETFYHHRQCRLEIMPTCGYLFWQLKPKSNISLVGFIDTFVVSLMVHCTKLEPYC